MNLLNMLDKKIVFFGSGSFLDRIMKYPIPFPFSYIVDNNQDKWGNIKYGKEIKNPDYLLKENKDDLLILVVSSFYDEIASQLEKMGFEVNNNYMSIFEFIILLKYKNLYPKKISLPFFNNEIFINPLDKRVKNLFLYKFHDNSRKNIKLWMTLVSTFDPTIVLDVGANYGEYMFSPIYKKYVSIIGIEANKNLIPYLNDSKNMHPNNSQIEVVNALVSDVNNKKEAFYLDIDYSNTSSAIKSNTYGNKIEKTYVKTLTIDSLLKEKSLGTENKLLFKIDVEGYEPFVLKGMKQTIDSFNNMLGYIEFNNEFIQNAGLDVNTYLSFLQERFYIYFIKDEEIIKYSSFENMKEYFCGSKIHTDLLLCKDSRIVEKEIINISQNI